jgi:hypothetical protein
MGMLCSISGFLVLFFFTKLMLTRFDIFSDKESRDELTEMLKSSLQAVQEHLQ